MSKTPLQIKDLTQLEVRSPSSPENFDLPSTGIVKGQVFNVLNTGTAATTVRASDTSTIATVPASAGAVISFVALSDAPTAASDWQVLIGTATNDQYGLVKKNKWQTKIVGSNVDNNTAFMSFNGLTIGNIYKLHIGLHAQVNVGGTDSAVTVYVDNNGTTEARLVAQDDQASNQVPLTQTVIFEAGATSVDLITASASVNSYIMADNASGRTSRVTIEECQNLAAETTDFT